MMNFKSMHRWNPICKGFMLSHFGRVCCVGQHRGMIHTIVRKSLVKYCKTQSKRSPRRERVNRIAATLTGLGHIRGLHGALDNIQNLPPHHISSKCQHSDVLKNVILHCTLQHKVLHVTLLTCLRTSGRPNKIRESPAQCATQLCGGLWGKKGTLKPRDQQPTMATEIPTGINLHAGWQREVDVGHWAPHLLVPCTWPPSAGGINGDRPSF